MAGFDDLKKYRAQKKAEEEKNKKKTITYKKPEATDSGDPLAIEERAKFAPFPSHVGASYDLYDSSNYLKDQLESNLYKVGGSEQIKKSGIINASDSIGKEAQWRKENYTESNLADNIDGDVDYWFNFLNKMSDDTTTTAQEVNNLAKARTGDTSWQKDDSLTKSQKAELGRMNYLAQRDAINAATKDVTRSDFDSDPEWNRFIAGMMAGDDIAIQQAVDKSGLKTNMTVPEYSANMKGVSALEQNKAAEQNRLNEFSGKNSEISAQIRSREDFAEKSQYVPDNMYGQQHLTDMWFESGTGTYTAEDGSTFTADQYRDMAANSLIYDWVQFGNDPNMREELEFRTAQLGDAVGGYYGDILDAIPYMEDSEREEFRYLYNNGTPLDRSAAMDYLYNLDITKDYLEDKAEKQKERLANAGFLEHAGMFLESVPQSVLNMIVGTGKKLDDVGFLEGFRKWLYDKTGADYRGYDEYSLDNIWGQSSGLTRGYQGEWLAENSPDWMNIPGTDWNLAQMGYNAAASGLDMAATGLLTGGTAGVAPVFNIGGKAINTASILSPLLMAGGSYNTQLNESLKAGRGEENAKRDADVAFWAEALSELLPFDNMFNNPGASPLGKVARGAASEFIGALAGGEAQAIYDTAAYGYQSDAGQYYSELLTHGYEPNEAKWMTALKFFGLDPVGDALTEGLSAGVHTGPVAIAESIANRTSGKNIIGNEGVADLVKVAESVGLDGSNAKILADVKAALEAEGNTDVSDITDADIEKAAAEKFEAEEAAPEDVVSEATQIDAQGVVDAVMQDVSGKVNSDVSAAVESAVNEAAEFLADDAADNGGVNTEGAINNAVIVAQEALGEVDGADAEVVKNAIAEAVKGSMRPQENAQGVQETAEGIAKDKGSSEGVELDSAEAMKFDPEAAKKAAAKQAFNEIDSMEGVENMSEEQRFEALITRTAEIFEQIKAEAEQAVQKAEQNMREREERSEDAKDTLELDDANAVEQAEKNAREQAERADETKDTLDVEDVDSVAEAERNMRERIEQAGETKDGLEVDDAEAVRNAEQNARDRQERADQQRNASVDGIITPEQAKTAREKGERSGKGKRSKGGKISPAKVGQLYRASMAKLDAQAQEVLSTAYARTLEGQLSEKGITGDAAKTISKQLADVIGGREFTPYIRNLITNNATVRQIYMDSMAKVETAETEKSILEYMAAGVHSKAAPAAANPEDMEADEIKIESEEGDTASEIVAKNAQVYLGEQAATMESMYNAETQDAAEYAEAFVRAANYGKDGRNIDVVLKAQQDGGSLSALTTEQVKAAYTIGREMQKNAPTAARKNSKGITVGKVDLSGINIGSLNKHQRASVYAAARLAKAVGFNIRFVESKANARGQYTTENGSWDARTMTLTLDVHAGSNSVRDTSYAMMHTMGHELTHYIKQFADAALWNDYQSFVMSHLSTKMDNAVLDGKIAKMMQQQKGLTREGAIEEIIADASVEALKNITEADIQKIADTNPGLLKKIANYIQKWVKETKAAIASAYSGTDIKHNDFANEMTDVLDETSKRWNELLANAAKNRRAEAQNEAINNVGIEINENGDTAYVANPELMYSLRSFNNSDYVTERDKAAAALAKKMGVSIEKAEAYIDDVASIAAIVANDRDRLDFEAEDEYSAMKHNSEYKYTMDFSTLCKKRLLYTGTFDAIQKQMSDTALTEDDYIRLRQMMAERGYEVACAFCYVESRRKNNGEIINKFLDVYKDAQKNGTDMELGAKNRRKAFKPEAGFTPKIADFNTSEGIANIMHNHRGVYDAYMYFMNARGVSKPKLIESRTDYRSEILSKFRSASAVRAMNRRGGLRLQSFSDFEVVNMLDMMQVVMDMSRVGLMSQAYTKVPAFARVFGGTGVKINLSLVTKGVDKNGKLIFDDIEGMPHKEAFKIRDMYSEHVGTILVGKDDATIRAAMADPRIDFIIPYHASGWSTENQNALGIGGYTNFTAGQNETNAATGKGVKNLQPSEYWDYSKTGDENAQIYLEKCREAGRVPKFPQYQNYPGYWKMLIDFKMYDNNGVGSPQRAVRPDFNLEEARSIMDNYTGGHQNLPVARDVVNDFVKEYKQEHEFIDDTVKLSARVTDQKTLDFLNNQETVTTYKTMQLVNGKLYPPMAAVVAGSYEDASELGTWEQATEHPELIKLDKKGKPQFTLNKGKGKGSLQAAYNPYMHSSNLVLNDQFSGAYDRPNLVTVECEVPASELTSGYHAQYAKDAVGWHAWHTGTVAGALRKSKGIERQVLLSRWIKPVRIVPDSEVAAKYKELLDGTGVSVPDNVVPPSLLQELKKAGVSITESGRVPKDDAVKYDMRVVDNGIMTDDVIVFDQNQVKYYDNDEPTADSRIMYQQRDLSNISDRELLVQALEGELTEAERDHLNRYKARVDELGEKQMRLEALNAKIVQLQAEGKTAKTSEELRAAQTNAKTLRDSIARVDAKLNQIESAKMIQEVVKRNRAEARKSAYALARERADERQRKAVEHAREVGQRKVDRLKESQGKEKYKAQILKDVKKLHGWLTTPSMKGSVPQFLQKPVAEFLESIDFTSARALKGGEATKADKKFADALEELRRVVGEINKQQGDIEAGAASFSGYIDLPADYNAEFDELVGKIKVTLNKTEATDIPFNRMTADQLHELSKMFRILNSSISKTNRLIANGRYESAKTASNETIDDMNSMKAKMKTNKVLESLNSLFNWKNTTPYYAFQRLGRGGKAIFEGLQDGWDKMARNSAKLIEFAKDTFDGKESKEWSRDVSEVTLSSGDVIQMTTAQKMSLYCHSKRAQSMGHLLGGGIRMSDIDGKRGATISQVDNYVLSEADIRNIIGSLTARQIEVADALQKFMNTTCKDWGNEISMKRFGFEQMTEDNYFPIETDANNRARIDDTKDGGTSMFRLLNMSSLKPLTPKANNAIIIRNIFDVFSDHSADMAKYNALALPILDYIKWYNYVERTDVVDASGQPTGQIKTRSTQKALERAYGVNAKQYLNTFIRNLNGEQDGGRNDGMINKMIGKVKAASVGANLRVYFLQITSLARAAYAISPKYLKKGLLKMKSLNPANAIKGTEAQEEIGILKWKDLGFYSTDINNSVRDLVKRDGGVLDKVRKAQMVPAGWGDNWVSNILYEAAKAEMADRHPKLEPGSDAYNKMLNKRVREIVYKTQVVDSTMTRSEFMRSKGIISQLTAFMSEPTLTVNMLNEGIQEAIAKKRGLTSEDLNPGGKITLAATVFTANAFLTAAVEAVFDGMRDDDDYEKFFEKYRAAFGGNVLDNVNIFNMLPYFKDFISIMQGYENNSMVTQAWQQVKDFQTAIDSWQEGKRPFYSVIYNGAKAASSLSGFALGNAMRDFTSLYNTFIADVAGTPKLQTYEDSKASASNAYYAALQAGDADKAEWIKQRAEINGITMDDISAKIGSLAKEDYISGNISEEEAVRLLMEYGGKDEDDAYWKVREWEHTGEDSYSKYTALREALGNKDRNAATAAYRELVDHGVDEKTISSELTKLYNSGEATSLLNLQMRSNGLYTSNLKLKTDGEKHPDDFDDFITAIVNGSDVSGEIRSLYNKGYTFKQCMSAINGAFGNTSDRYRIMEKYNSADARILLDRILDAYDALGLDRDDELAWIEANWIMA